MCRQGHADAYDAEGVAQATLCIRGKAGWGAQTSDRQIPRQTQTDPRRRQRVAQTHRQLRAQTDRGADRPTQTACPAGPASGGHSPGHTDRRGGGPGPPHSWAPGRAALTCLGPRGGGGQLARQGCRPARAAPGSGGAEEAASGGTLGGGQACCPDAFHAPRGGEAKLGRRPLAGGWAPAPHPPILRGLGHLGLAPEWLEGRRQDDPQAPLPRCRQLREIGRGRTGAGTPTSQVRRGAQRTAGPRPRSSRTQDLTGPEEAGPCASFPQTVPVRAESQAGPAAGHRESSASQAPRGSASPSS